MNSHSVVIIGAGPAGLAAAMQLSRQGYEPLVLERERVGGLLWNANLLENYPGFPTGISGPELVKLFQRQAERLGVKVVHETAVSTTYQDGMFQVRTTGRELTAPYLVAATGTTPHQLTSLDLGSGVEDRLYYEVFPLLGKKDLRILIIGAGDAAFDYALNLAQQNQVVILNRGSDIKALPLLVNRAADHPRISYYPNQPLSSVELAKDGALQLQAGRDGERRSYRADYLLAAVGREPETGFADPSIMKNRGKLLKENRLFMIGDLVNGSHRQTAIAVGDGVRAAMIIGELIQKDDQ